MFSLIEYSHCENNPFDFQQSLSNQNRGAKRITKINDTGKMLLDDYYHTRRWQ